MRGQDRVVWLHDGSGNLRSRVYTEFEFALLAIVNGKALHQQGTETRACATTERVEDEESLKARAVISDAADLIQNLIDELLSNGVVTTSVVIGSIFFASDHLLGMEEGTVGASADFVDHIGLKVAIDGTRDIFAVAYGESQ